MVTVIYSLPRRLNISRILITLAFTTLFAACSTSDSNSANDENTILPGDPRFNVFQLSNSAGDGSFISSRGTVYLSFKSDDSRYCRAARFHEDRTAIIACRNKLGWQIEATSDLGASGGSVTQAVNDAVFRLNPKTEFLNERDIIKASQRDWQ